MQDKLVALQRELALITSTVPADILAQAEAIGKLTDSEKELLSYKEKQAELDEKSAALLQKRLVAEAIANDRKVSIGADGSVNVEDEKGKMIEITDFKAKEYAIDSEAKRAALEADTKVYTDLLDTELKKLQEIDAQKRVVEQEFTKFFKSEIASRNASLAEYIQMAQQAAAAMRAVGLERQAQQAEQVAGGNVSTSNKTVNITNNVSNNVD